MSYHPAECIFDLIAACGPQEFTDFLTECHTQAVPFPSRRAAGAVTVDEALTALEQAGIIERDSTAYDLTEFGYSLIAGRPSI